MKNQQYQYKRYITLVISFCIALVLQSCNATHAKGLKENNSGSLSSKNASTLFNKGLRVYLKGFEKGKTIKGTYPVIRDSFLKKLVANKKHGELAKRCQLLGTPVEIDGKAETKAWLITTQGQGICQSKISREPRYFWIIQQRHGNSSKRLISGKAKSVSVYKSKTSPYSRISISSSGYIPVKPGDKLATGDYVQVNSSKNKNVYITCNYDYQMQNGRYTRQFQMVNVNVPTGSMLNAHTPEMYWAEIKDPRYHCEID